MVFWKNFRLSYISGTIWVEYIKYVTFEHFIRWSQSGARNQSWKIHDFVTMHTSNSIFVRFTCKMDDKIYFNYIYFLNLLLYIYIYIYIYIYLTNNIFILQATGFGREPNLMKLFVKTHVQSDDHQKRVHQLSTIELNTL